MTYEDALNMLPEELRVAVEAAKWAFDKHEGSLEGLCAREVEFGITGFCSEGCLDCYSK